MELDKSKQYLVYNYNGSPVAVTTRNDNFTVSAGTDESPATLPLTLEEIMYINNNSNVFKVGLLWFEKDYEEAIYDYLRIRDYDKILTNAQIRDILLHPTPEGLEKILAITNDTYFNRVRGIHIGLKNSTDIPSRIDRMIDARYTEIINKKATTSIKISRDSEVSDVSEANKRIEELEKQIAKLTEMIARAEKTETPEEPKPSESNSESAISVAKSTVSKSRKTGKLDKE